MRCVPTASMLSAYVQPFNTVPDTRACLLEQVTASEVVQLREVLVRLKQDDVLDIRERSRYALRLLDRLQTTTVVNT